ncbi:rod shape-determining protein MreC [mine drainage metagenome]|uniref:Cell shape-determining protein MreC n=1 Tax=mine drainage metagenome TaxID=410659 RepID=T1D3F4_9ZZZZ
MAASLALLILRHGAPLGLPLAQITMEMGAFIEQPVSDAADFLESIGPALASRRRLIRTNRALRDEIFRLRAQLLTERPLVFQNRRLKALLGRIRAIHQSFRLVRVLRIDLDPYRQEVVIGAGQKAGLARGDAVIDAHGLVGQVGTVSAHLSRVLLITDPSEMVPVEVAATGLLTFSVGSGIPTRLRLPYLPNDTRVRVGQLLISSGLGGHYAYGFPVAVVTHVILRPNRSFARVDARPLAAISEDRELLVLVRHPSPRPKPLRKPAVGQTQNGHAR